MLPLGVIITDARLYLPAGAVASSTATGVTKIQTSETPTATVLVTRPLVALNAGFNVDQPNWFVCDTDLKRRLVLTSDGNIDDASTRFVAIVEYIG